MVVADKKSRETAKRYSLYLVILLLILYINYHDEETNMDNKMETAKNGVGRMEEKKCIENVYSKFIYSFHEL